MFSKSAEQYDKIYFGFKDYPGEAKKIAALITSECPDAHRLLDVACGTGEHAKLLQENHGYKVDGLDLDENLIALAGRKNPNGLFCHADMVDFDLTKFYDVVMCLFSSIGYVKTLDRVTLALKRFKAHVKDGGLILVEPWFPPGGLTPGKIFLHSAQTDELSAVRMGYSSLQERLSTLHFEYLVGTQGNIEHYIEKHELGLFTEEEMGHCFEEAGLSFSYDKEGLSGRGLYVARKG